jgi:hypothetical protein
LAAVLALGSPPAQARWENRGLSSDGDQLQVLRDPQPEVAPTNKRPVQSTTLRLLLKPHTLQDPRNGQWVTAIVSEWIFKCQEESGVIKHSRIQYEDGSSKKSDADSGYRAISQDDLVYAEMLELCGDGYDR